MEEQKKDRIYSKNQIEIATFFGGAFIGGYLLARNFRAFGEIQKAEITFRVGFLASWIFYMAVAFFPKSLYKNISLPFYLIPVLIVAYIIRKYQKEKIKEYVEKGYPAASNFSVLLKTVVFFIITFLIAFVSLVLFDMIQYKTDRVGYMRNYCNYTYHESEIRSDKKYVPEAATCFVFEKLKGQGYSLFEIDEVLNLEYQYQKQEGLAGTIGPTRVDSFSTYDPTTYIRGNQRIPMSKDKINEILQAEDGYLKRIGVVH